MTNTERNFQSIGADLWQATDGSGVLVSLNGSATMFTVESANVVHDIDVTSTVQDAFRSAIAFARTI